MKMVTVMNFSPRSISTSTSVAKEQMCNMDLEAWGNMESRFGAGDCKKYASTNVYGTWVPELI